MSQIVRIIKQFRSRRTAKIYLREKYFKYYIILNNFIKTPRPNGAVLPSELPALDEIKARALIGTDVNDHLVTMFVEAVVLRPSLIVELGVRGGESTFVFSRAAQLCGSHLVSVDIEDCSDVVDAAIGTFVKSDDIAFAGRFADWCGQRDIRPEIDLLFIDTSHEYEHTVEEIKHWFPFLSARSKVILHDTHIGDVYRRKNGTVGRGWDNERGVIRALEEFFGKPLEETRDFVDFKNGWLITHYHACNGLTILDRVASKDPAG